MTPASNDHPDRAAINRANSQHSTGPRTEAGKQRTKLNALRHGLTGQTIVLPTEDHSAYERHSRSFLDEYQPKEATETQLVQSLIDSSWQLNRAAAVESALFSLGITENEDRIRANHPEGRSRPRHGPGLPRTQPRSPTSASTASASPASSNAPSLSSARSRPSAAKPKSANSTKPPRS